ncbi:MAG TPA: hypothetical protein VFA63_04610 [Pseudonocardiaceae bacterium]|nr:hypothetical protein [Pseudonocardiaceae bacterium]
MSAEVPDRAAVQTPRDRFLNEPRRWPALRLIGPELLLLYRDADVAASLWRLPGALR